jgi:hypothetical protein
MENKTLFDKLFGQQIDEETRCDGMYVKDEAEIPLLINEFMNNTNSSFEDAVKFIDQRRSEWEEHKGDVMIYFIAYEPKDTEDHFTMQIVRAWESEFDTLLDQYDFEEPQDGSIYPRAKLKNGAA